MTDASPASGTASWRHQQDAVDKLGPIGRGGLFFEMGTGKTKTALELLRYWDCRLVLILAPMSVVAVWPKEARKHLPEDVAAEWRILALDKGSIADRAATIKKYVAQSAEDGKRLAVILNYEAVIYPPMPVLLKQVRWDCIVMDECHRLKAPGGQQSRLVSQISDRVIHRLGLTGTPMPHSPLDVYAQYRAIDKSVYGVSYSAFRARYARMGGFQNHEVVGYQHLEDLHTRMYRIACRVRAADVLDLPPCLDEERYCQLTAQEAKAYTAFERDLIAQIDDGVVTASNVLVKLLRLSQMTSGFWSDETNEGTERSFAKSSKAALLEETLEDCAHDDARNPEPIVVFCRFKHDIQTVHETCAKLDLPSLELSGGRDELEAWQAGGGQVLAAQLKKGGLGVDLTRARIQLYYSLDYSLGDYEQTRARIHRHGQTRPVTIIHLLAQGTIDEKVMRALAARKQVVQAVVDDMLRKEEPRQFDF